jgi:predicted nuclease of predicted toxin-antitoxin system
MKLLLDACLPLDWLEFLRQHGYDCQAWVQIGPPNAPDSDVMRYAREQGLVVLTHDLDFSRLLAFSRATHPSVIQFRAPDIRPAAFGPQLLQALRLHEPLLRQGALITVEPDRSRSRILPLGD